MKKISKNAAVLWTGGKDSSLALYEATLLGYAITSLVTFAPDEPRFLAHPLNFMKYQAECLGIPHDILTVHEPLRESYEKAIYSLRERDGVTTLVSGDIAQVSGHPNWIRECSDYAGIDVLTPLWGSDRLELLNRLLSYKFKVIFSCVKRPWFTEEWLGMELDRVSLDRLCKLHAETGLDVCGEQGEYHSLVLDGPHFKKKRIHIVAYSKRAKDSLMFIDIQKVSLRKKTEKPLDIRFGPA